MRKNLIQTGTRAADGRFYIEHDWFDRGMPGNIKLAEHVYIDTSYGFSGFHSLLPEAMIIGNGSGCYDRASFIVGPKGKIEAGEFNIFNGSTFICNHYISVGNHCMFAWGSVITDCWIDKKNITPEYRRAILQSAPKDSFRSLPVNAKPAPVVIEDNVWVGFDAVILPGVKLGRGCIIGSKSIVTADIPPYAVAAGNPIKIVRYLDADDTAEAKENALNEFLSPLNIIK